MLTGISQGWRAAGSSALLPSYRVRGGEISGNPQDWGQGGTRFQCMANPVTEATIRCPQCGAETAETMPTDATVRFWKCPACTYLVIPKLGDCCVFCSYGSLPCPPRQGT
jgi:hypothetical protein